MNRYEGLFILNLAGKEEGLKDVVDKLAADITTAGGKVENVQKMDKKSFTRVANKRNSSGYYVNIVFEAKPTVLATLHGRYKLNPDVFRVLFTEAGNPVPPPAQPKI